MSTACLALEICRLVCNVSKHGLEVGRGKRRMLLSDRFIPVIHKCLERTEDFWTEQHNLSRRLTPGPFHTAQCLNKDGKLIQETILRRRSLLIAYIPLSRSIDSTENLAKSRLRNQFGAEELCLIPHILLPTSENVVEGLLLWIRIREKVIRSFEQPDMREVLRRPSFLVRVLEIDAITSGEILGDDDHRIGRPEEPRKSLFSLFALSHLCSKLGIKKDHGDFALSYRERKGIEPGGIGQGLDLIDTCLLPVTGKSGKKKPYLMKRIQKEQLPGTLASVIKKPKQAGEKTMHPLAPVSTRILFKFIIVCHRFQELRQAFLNRISLVETIDECDTHLVTSSLLRLLGTHKLDVGAILVGRRKQETLFVEPVKIEMMNTAWKIGSCREAEDKELLS